jgi:glycosyltransferase involved in cell wall biosynthesis
MYNSEKTINKCIKSLLIQKNLYFEIIVIDDNSKDKSLKIVDSLINKNPGKIKLVKNKKNYGVSYSRNIGIKVSKGDYLFFIDSDDFLLEKDISSYIFKSLNKYPDVLILKNYYIKYGQKIHHSKNIFPTYGKLNKNQNIENYFLKNFLKKQCWSYIFQRKLIKKNKIFFLKQTHIAEDQEFILKTLINIKKYSFINQPIYCNNMNMSSLSHKMNYDACQSYLNVIISLLNIINTKNLNKNQKSLISNQINEFGSEILPRILVTNINDLKKLNRKIYSNLILLKKLKQNNLIELLKKKEFNLEKFKKFFIKKILNKLKITKHKKIFIFSRNAYGIALANILKNNDYNYSGFIDNNSLLQNQTLLKKKIFTPNHFRKTYNKQFKDIVIIISNQQSRVLNNIRKQLLEIGYENKKLYKVNFGALIQN